MKKNMQWIPIWFFAANDRLLNAVAGIENRFAWKHQQKSKLAFLETTTRNGLTFKKAATNQFLLFSETCCDNRSGVGSWKWLTHLLADNNVGQGRTDVRLKANCYSSFRVTCNVKAHASFVSVSHDGNMKIKPANLSQKITKARFRKAHLMTLTSRLNCQRRKTMRKEKLKKTINILLHHQGLFLLICRALQ